MEQHTLRVIARVHSEFPGKFGIPIFYKCLFHVFSKYQHHLN